VTETLTEQGRNLLVGVSVSEPSPDELIGLGLSDLHVRHAFIEIVRHVLALDGSIAYGGDLRAAGYTESLFDLVRAYNPRDLAGPERVTAYLAWPIGLALTPAQRADLVNVATLEEVAPPAGAPTTLPPIPDRNPSELLWNSLSLTKMRHEMTAALGARVVLGGRISGQQGLLPGLIEEAALAIGAEKPLYVVGGFGGCGRVLASALMGAAPEELALEYQLDHTSRYRELHDQAVSAGVAPSFEALGKLLRGAAVEGLHNGLSQAENERLFGTDDVDEVVALLLRGLRRIASTRSP
jgi:hypothetical protein